MRSNWTTQEIDAYLRMNYVGRNLRVVPYTYPMIFTDIAIGAQVTDVLQATANADFIIFEISYVSTESDDVVYWSPGLDILMVDSGSNSQYTQAPINLRQIASHYEITTNLPYPRKLGGRTTLSVQITNNSASEQPFLDLAFSGVLVYLMG